jgi:two-component system phosphate regulon response regulator OmpR
MSHDGDGLGAPVRILVVDDEPHIRLLLQRAIVRWGYAVEGVSDSSGAMERFGREHFDVVITDLRMPGMNGLELAAWIRAACPGTGVIVMTAYVASSDSWSDQDGLVYLPKPFGDIHRVREALEGVLQRQRSP